MRRQRSGQLWREWLAAFFVLCLLGTQAHPISMAVRKQHARSQFDVAERMRVELNGMPRQERSPREYQRVMDAYRSVYYTAPACSKADASVLAVAELLAESGRAFNDPKTLRNAIAQYEFLRREYPGSKYRFAALFTIGQIYKNDLQDSDKARETFQEVIHRYAHLQLAADARDALAEMDQQAHGKSKPPALLPTDLKPQEPHTPDQKSQDDEAPAAAESKPLEARPQESKPQEFAAEPSHPGLPLVTGIRHWSTPDYTRVAIDLEQEVKYEAGRIANPDRIFFDLHDTRLASTLAGKTYEVSDSFLRRVRVAQFQKGMVRVVLEVDAVSDYSAFLLPNPYRLIIDIHGRKPNAPQTPLARAEQADEKRAGSASRQEEAKPEEKAEGNSAASPESTKQLVSAIQAVIERSGSTSEFGPKMADGSFFTADSHSQPRGLSDDVVHDTTHDAAHTTRHGRKHEKPQETASEASHNEAAHEAFSDETSSHEHAHESAHATPAASESNMKTSPEPVAVVPVDAPVEAHAEPQSSAVAPVAAPAGASGGEVEMASARPFIGPVLPQKSTRSEVTYLDGVEVKATDKPTTEPTVQVVAPRAAASSTPAVSSKKSQHEGEFHQAEPTADGSRSLIRALGLKVGRIVIDAGHGGHDTGTIGPGGLLEKDLVLDVSLRLGRLLQGRMGADVIYTREDDTFVPLETRTAIANEQQADLFISIHANSSPDASARGVETYYLNFNPSPDALEVAARENAVSEKNVHELGDLVKKIALKEKVEESREFATDVQHSLYQGLMAKDRSMRDRGVKKAPFIVLIGANMPSILAEISFVSNPGDERKLETPEYRQKIAESLYKGIARYINGLSGVKMASKTDGQ